MKKLIYIFLTILIVGCSTDDDNNNDNSSDLQKEWLYTHTSLDATATNSTTIVIPLTGDIFAFTDRPNREYKYISGDEFASYWNDYDDANSFKLDPPNAVLTWVDEDGVEEVEVVITDADFDGTNMIYTIENSTITTNQSFEEVSLFVDGNGTNNNVYLASNGVTIKASSGADIGDTGTIDGVVYTIVSSGELQSLISDGDDVTKAVTTLVTNMSLILSSENEATNFNQDISSWDVSSVTTMESMFQGNTAFNQDISSWDVSSVTTMKNMFGGNGIFNQDISSWDVSSVSTMEGMFGVNDAFNQDISSWDVSSVTTMEMMFQGNTAFNSSLFFWDVSNVTDMSNMFFEAEAFNQNLEPWSVINVTSCDGFSDGATSWTLPQPNFTNCDPN